jgi:hypothetical protein
VCHHAEAGLVAGKVWRDALAVEPSLTPTASTWPSAASRRGFPRSAPAPDPSSRHLHAGHRLARTAGTRQTHPGTRSQPRFRCRPHAFGTSAVVHSRSPSRLAPDASRAPFPQCSPPRLIHRSSLRWFRTSPCIGGPGGPPPSPVQHHNQRHDLLHRNPQSCSWRTDLGVLPP